jgi:hypothetical protein
MELYEALKSANDVTLAITKPGDPLENALLEIQGFDMHYGSRFNTWCKKNIKLPEFDITFICYNEDGTVNIILYLQHSDILEIQEEYKIYEYNMKGKNYDNKYVAQRM